jgi:hypothetical protein
VVASLLRPRQLKLVAQDIQERGPSRDRRLDPPAIYGERNREVLRRQRDGLSGATGWGRREDARQDEGGGSEHQAPAQGAPAGQTPGIIRRRCRVCGVLGHGSIVRWAAARFRANGLHPSPAPITRLYTTRASTNPS